MVSAHQLWLNLCVLFLVFICVLQIVIITREHFNALYNIPFCSSEQEHRRSGVASSSPLDVYAKHPVNQYGRRQHQIYTRTTDAAKSRVTAAVYGASASASHLLYSVHANAVGPTILFIVDSTYTGSLSSELPLFITFLPNTNKPLQTRGTLEHWLNAVSYGRLFLAPENVTVVYYPQLYSAIDASRNNDDPTGHYPFIKKMHDSNVINSSAYQQILLVTTQGAHGKGTLGCDLRCVTDTGIKSFMHEFGHNLGLGHNGRSNGRTLDMYQDTAFNQGSGGYLKGYSSPHLYRLGWAMPVVVELHNLTYDYRGISTTSRDVPIYCAEQTDYHSIALLRYKNCEAAAAYRRKLTDHYYDNDRYITYTGVYMHMDAAAWRHGALRMGGYHYLDTVRMGFIQVPIQNNHSVEGFSFREGGWWIGQVVSHCIRDTINTNALRELARNFDDHMASSIKVKIRYTGQKTVNLRDQPSGDHVHVKASSTVNVVDMKVSCERHWAQYYIYCYEQGLNDLQNKIAAVQVADVQDQDVAWPTSSSVDDGPAIHIKWPDDNWRHQSKTYNELDNNTRQQKKAEYLTYRKTQLLDDIRVRRNKVTAIAKQKAVDLDNMFAADQFNKSSMMQLVEWINSLHTGTLINVALFDTSYTPFIPKPILPSLFTAFNGAIPASLL
jgi:hypothetical protein